MSRLIERIFAWLGVVTADGHLFAEEAMVVNLRRLRWLLPVVICLNLMFVLVFWWGVQVDAPRPRAWKTALEWTHLCMAACLLPATLAAVRLSGRGKPGRWGRLLQFTVPLVLMLFAVAFTVIDQWVTPNISPFLVGCAFIGLLLLMPPRVAISLFIAGYVFFFIGLGLTQQDPMQLLTNRISGLCAAVLGLVLSLVLWRNNSVYVLLQRELKSRNEDLLQQQEELVWLAKRDALTGLFNRGELLRLAEAELLRARRHESDTSAIMVDIDFFKNINDVYGHPAGDSAIKHTAALLLGGVRATDVAARVGGEEFMILLPGTAADSALSLAQKLRIALEKAPARITSDLKIPVTASFGVGTVPAGQGSTVAWLYAACDHALYEAKRLGRNRVEKTEPDSSLTPSDFQRMRRH